MPINDFITHPLTWQPRREDLSRPKYASLASQLQKDIEEGLLPPGTRLPPQRMLADYLDINFTTVTRAYEICRERSLVYGITGRGTFVSPLPVQSIEKENDIIDLGAVQCFPTIGSSLIIDAAREVLNRDYTKQLFSYAERDGAPRHRAAGAFWLNRFNIPAVSDQIAIFPGVQNALSTILTTFFRPGDALAVDTFTYSNLIGAANLLHIHLVPIENDKYGMKVDALIQAIKKSPLRGVFLMPTCANPTTITIPPERKKELVKIFRKHDLFVIEDDANLLPNESSSFFTLLPENTFYLTGNTRFISPGLRIAFVAYPKRLKEKFLSAFHKLTIKSSALDAEIMSELILSSRASEILSLKINRAVETNKIFNKIFPRLVRIAKDVPFFRTVPLHRSNKTGQETEEILLSKNVRVCHSYRFAAKRNPSESFLRISLSSTNSKTALAEALRAVKNFSKCQ
jgi:DNA-binding transcriptional MocR family regulator